MTKPTHMDVTVNAVFPWALTFDTEAKTEDGERTLTAVYAERALEDPGCWRGLLKVIEGKRATEYVLGPMTASEVASIEDECTRVVVQPDGSHAQQVTKPAELLLRAFKASLRNILHGPEPKLTKRGGVERVDPDWIERHFARGTNRLVMQFIGQVAWAWNRFSEDDEKNS